MKIERYFVTITTKSCKLLCVGNNNSFTVVNKTFLNSPDLNDTVYIPTKTLNFILNRRHTKHR